MVDPACVAAVEGVGVGKRSMGSTLGGPKEGGDEDMAWDGTSDDCTNGAETGDASARGVLGVAPACGAAVEAVGVGKQRVGDTLRGPKWGGDEQGGWEDTCAACSIRTASGDDAASCVLLTDPACDVPLGGAGVGIWRVEITIRGPKSDGDEEMMV